MSSDASDAVPNRVANSSTKFARAISWIGHPLVFVSAMVSVLVFYRLANRVGLSVLLALLVAVVLPTALLLIRGVRSGRWSDADVSVHTERVIFYPRAILLSLGGVVLLLVLRAPHFVVRGAVATLALLAVAAVINQGMKISLHAMFAFYCALILFSIGPVTGICALVLAVLVFWSRLHLGRHSLIEALLGTVLGMTGAVLVVWGP